jgi:hypothetical protein
MLALWIAPNLWLLTNALAAVRGAAGEIDMHFWTARPEDDCMDRIEDVRAHGWHRDPCQTYAERWLSNGLPTSLARDAGGEATDPAPSETDEGPLVESATRAAADAANLDRADDPAASAEYDATGSCRGRYGHRRQKVRHGLD